MVEKVETNIKLENKLEVLDIKDIQDSVVEKDTRKLASVQIIADIKEHTNADKLVIASVLGWNVVCSKNDNLKVGDKVIYFEIDSLLPQDKSWTQFLKEKKFKLKTAKIRGELSQGLIMPLKILEEYNITTDPEKYSVGQDLTSTLNILKYLNDADEDLPSGKKSVHAFPSEFGFVKTDEPRIQSSPKLIEEFKGKPYYATLKYDGTSSTFFMDYEKDKEFYICSRNQRRPYDITDVYSRIADKFKIKEILEKDKGRYAIQGEIYGPKIQNNPFKRKDLDFAVFNVYDYVNKRYLDYEEILTYCKDNSLPYVQVMVEGDNFEFDLNKLKELSKGNYPETENPREGLVFRLKTSWSGNNYRASFKIINDDFLLQKK
jgi:RNA ligase (TIGR02306 family)